MRPKSANEEHPRHLCMGVPPGKQITICSTWFFVTSMILDDRFHGEKWWCTDIRVPLSVGRNRVNLHILFSYFHWSYTIRNLCWTLLFACASSFFCDTNVALDSGLSLGAWNLKLTTPDRKKQSVKARNLLTEIQERIKGTEEASPIHTLFHR